MLVELAMLPRFVELAMLPRFVELVELAMLPRLSWGCIEGAIDDSV